MTHGVMYWLVTSWQMRYDMIIRYWASPITGSRSGSWSKSRSWSGYGSWPCSGSGSWSWSMSGSGSWSGSR